MSVAVRVAAPSDHPAVIDIDGAVHSEQYLTASIVKGECLVATLDEETAGFAIWNSKFYEQPFIWLLVTRPAYRRHGVASALVRQIESLCVNSKLFTSTNASNSAMQQFCDRLGFQRSGYIENLDEGDPELVYVKWLHREAT